MTSSEDVEVMVAKAFTMLGFIRRVLLEVRDPCTLKSLYTSLVRPKLEYVSCVWNSFYDVRVDSGIRAKAVYSICFAWFGLNRHA
jgi:hypothetical protein